MLGKLYVNFNSQEFSMTKMFSYVISLLANLNARGQTDSNIYMSDVTTLQITVGSSAQQQTSEGSTLLKATSVVAPGTSDVDTV
jgi:hypothetical protein